MQVPASTLYYTSEVDRCSAGTALAGRGLDRVGGVVAGASGSGYGPPFGDDGALAEGNDGVLVFQAGTVGLQGVQPALPYTATASTTVQLLPERTRY